ncbi:MAG: ACR3 family arsenite efflux transporter [Saccharospirillaceae bacterium]|nr:ACR3 family arsenite efflux transporter [Pseudomonadales bacterium]NRB80646.1 ACR3 family arsenite efflux transporter [Saccharospirillaceae bacterium]
MGLFERYLSVWVALCIVAGVGFGLVIPGAFETLADLTVANVNIPIAIFIWVMIYPMMAQVDFSSIKDVGKKPKGLALTLVVNWLIKPFTMALLGWLFFRLIFADIVDPETATQYIAGMILLGVAPCTAMVFVWSQLTKGDANYTLVQVSINDVIMIFAFAPLAGWLLGISNITVPWDTLILSVLLYVLLPLMAGIITRKLLSKKQLNNFFRLTKPISISGLLGIVLLLFGFQAHTILANPLAILLIAIPLLIQTYGIFFIALYGAKLLKLPHNIAAPACMIGTSNFFELSVAVAISVFGLHSGAALATVVGVLVEVPVMLSLVWLMNKNRESWG